MTVEVPDKEKDKDKVPDFWQGWADFLGYEVTDWTTERVKELLRGLIESGDIKEWANDEAILYSILETKGLNNLSKNKHRNFFKNLPEVVHIQKALDEIKEYISSDSKTPPDLSKYTGTYYGEVEGDDVLEDENIQEANAQELEDLLQREPTDPLDYGDIPAPKEILDKIGKTESISPDEEVMRLLVNHSIGKLWRGILRVVESSGLNSKNVIGFLNTITKNGNKWRDEVVDTFLGDYNGTRYILDHLPKNYSYEYEPKLMQAYVAHKVLRNKYFMNLSGVGAGKTLSAILASKVINSKITVIVCPNDIVGQWEATIKKVFPDSLVYTSADPIDVNGGIGRKAFSIKRKESKYQYVVINYEKFSLADSRKLILALTEQKIDFVILDEVHFAKKRGDDNSRYARMISKRNANLNLFRSEVKRHNRNVRVLGMTATPVINDLTECRSLIELVTGKDYRNELSTNASIRNAVAFYGKLQIMSVRELPNYYVNIDPQEVNVTAHTDEDILMLIRNPLKLEQILTEARIPEIIKRISKTGKTIIYTEYVDQILQRLREEVRKAGHSFTEYTGLYKELDSFVKGKAQVLIASKPISVGVDGLQDVCSNLIINTLPWTNAHYQQLVGRLVRRGQLRDTVYVHIIKSSINGYPYDERLKWNRIRWKRSLSDCVTDGVMPLKNLVSVAEAAKELKNWLERMNRNEIMMFERKDIDVPLTQEEIRQRNRVFGDFANMNRQINKERSDTTHKRIKENPIYLIEYHRQMREAKNEWGEIIPARIIAEKIKILQGPRYMKKLIVGDFGCGECELSSILNENKVHSFDHHNILNEEKIKSCDMKDTSQYLKDSSIDVAVFSLSLMSTNWYDYIKEANRVLVDRGYIFIAETTRSLHAKGSLFSHEEGRLHKLKEILDKEGFEIMKEEPIGRFTFIDAQKS